MKILAGFSALLLMASLPAVAQTHYCLGGDLDHLTPAQMTTCKAKLTQVREAVRRRGAPSGWHFLVVCDEGSWQDVAALTGKREAALREVNFQTDRAMQVTFLRGGNLSAEGDDAGRLLNAALEGVPGRYTQPGIGVTPAPIPNVEQNRVAPTLLMAEEHAPDQHRQDEVAAGQ